MTTTILAGHTAIEFAERNGLTLSKFSDPTEGPRRGLTPAEAREVAAQDPGLIYLDTEDKSRAWPCPACGEMCMWGDAQPTVACDDCRQE